MPKLGIALIQAESVAIAGTETLIQIVTPSGSKAKVKEWGVSMDDSGTSAKTPCRVDLLRQTTAGTASALTTVKNDPDDPALLITAQKTFTAEPTAGDILWSEYLPVTGFDRVQLPLGEEVVVDESGRLGLRVVNNSGATINCTAYIKYEEC